MSIWWTLLTSIVAGALGIYYYLYKSMNYFKKRGIPYVEPTIALGSSGPNIFRKLSHPENVQRIYNVHPEARYVGFFDMVVPIIMIRDPELIKTVTIKNFDHFHDHRQFVDTSLDPLFARNLFALRGERWRRVRSILTPAFSSSKMKTMFKLVSQCGKDLAEYVTSISSTPIDMELKDTLSRFTNDVIATTAFGISVNSLRDRDNEFYLTGKNVTNFDRNRTLRVFLARCWPSFARFFNLKVFDDNESHFFGEVISSTVATRDAEKIVRPDMIQLMMQARDENEKAPFSLDEMTSQAFSFFLGGFDTISTVLSFVTHLLGTHPFAREKLCAEIDDVIAKSEDGELTYDALHGMKYLDAVVNETMRLYPPATTLDRICTNSFELPPAAPGCESFLVEAGTIVWIPSHAIHRDSKYFEKPDQFDPDRFNDENKSKIAPCTFFPFGLGPRSCIANRFAMMEVKIGLFHLFAKCKFSTCSKTSIPIKLERTQLGPSSENGFWLRVEKRS